MMMFLNLSVGLHAPYIYLWCFHTCIIILFFSFWMFKLHCVCKCACVFIHSINIDISRQVFSFLSEPFL